MGKQLFHFRGNLCRKGFIGLHNKRRTIELFYGFSHGKRFTGPRNSQQRLVSQSLFNAPCKLLDGLRLITGRLKRRYNREALFSAFTTKTTELCSYPF